MDEKTFDEQIIRRLKVASNAGDTINEVGTLLIGHAPHIAPKAYVHTVYAPLNKDDREELRNRLGRPLPFEYEAFLGCANGMAIFEGSVRVFGYVPVKRRAAVSFQNYPSSIMIPNVSARIRGLRRDAVVVGWYKANGTYAVVEENGTVSRFDPKSQDGVMQSWPSFDTWLISEICRMASTDNWKYV